MIMHYELLVLETAEGQHSKKEFTVEKNPTLEPDFPRVSETGTGIASGNSIVSVPVTRLSLR